MPALTPFKDRFLGNDGAGLGMDSSNFIHAETMNHIKKRSITLRDIVIEWAAINLTMEERLLLSKPIMQPIDYARIQHFIDSFPWYAEPIDIMKGIHDSCGWAYADCKVKDMIASLRKALTAGASQLPISVILNQIGLMNVHNSLALLLMDWERNDPINNIAYEVKENA